MPPCGQLEAAGLGPRGAGEGALLVAEELALQQVLREGAAVDGDEGLAARGPLVVEGAGHQLLAGAGLAGDSTEEGVSATFSMTLKTSCMATDAPTMGPGPAASGARLWRERSLCREALATTLLSSSCSKGLEM